jgi:YVTN family beta-propeller protein
MRSGRKLLIQSNMLWAGVFLAMAALFLLAFAVQIGAAPLDNAPKSTPPAKIPGATPSLSGLRPQSNLSVLQYLQYLPIILQGGSSLTPTPTPTGCVPTRGSVQLATGSAPYGSAVDEDTGNIFVAAHGSGAQSSSIVALNGTTMVGTVSMGSFTLGGAWGVAYNPVNKKIYVTDEAAGQLLIINPASRVVEKALGGLASPRGVAIDRTSGTAYVGSSGAAELRRYTLSDVSANTQGAGVNIGNWPTGVAVDKQGRIWVTTQGELVRVTWTDSGTTTWKRGLEHSFGIAYNAGTDRLYVTTGGGSSLVAFNVSGSGDPVEVAGSPFKTSPEYNLDWPALNAATGRLYVAGRITAGVDHSRASKLWVFDVGASAFLTPPLDLDSWNDGTMMRGLSLDKQGRVYVSSEYTDRVYVLNDCGGSGPTPTPTPPTPCTASQGSVQLAVGSAPWMSWEATSSWRSMGQVRRPAASSF